MKDMGINSFSCILWGAAPHSLGDLVSWRLCACVVTRFTSAGLLETPRTVARQTPLSMGFFRQESFFFFLAILRIIWDLSSPTRDRTHAPCSGSPEFQPLDRQGSPTASSFITRIQIFLFYAKVSVFWLEREWVKRPRNSCYTQISQGFGDPPRPCTYCVF